jgi:hypothetical protein
MARRKALSLTSEDISHSSSCPEIIFKRISSGFFCDIRSDLNNGIPFLHLNLSSLDCVEEFTYLDENGLSCSARRLCFSGGRVIELKSQDQVIDIDKGLRSLKNYLIKGLI